MAIRWYVATATDPQEAVLEIISGTVLVRDPATGVWIGAANKMRLREGDSIKTDDVSRAMVTFFEGSPVILFPRTEITILRSRVSKFEPKTNHITMRVQQGYVRVAVAPQPKATQRFVVETPQAVATLLNGSYSVEVNGTGSQFAAREGEGVVVAAGTEVVLRQGQRTTVSPGKAPSPPQRARIQLVANGDFREGLAGWREVNNLEVPDDVEGKTLLVNEDARPAVRFWRLGSRNSHAENGIVQLINRDVSDFLTLKLSLDLRLSYQSLSGGGFRGSEYPVMVKIRYKDVYGNEQLWVRGFYYHNQQNYSVLNGEQVLQNWWYPYEKTLIGPDGIEPRPFHIISIQVSASGWDYDSMVRSVSLTGE